MRYLEKVLGLVWQKVAIFLLKLIEIPIPFLLYKNETLYDLS